MSIEERNYQQDAIDAGPVSEHEATEIAQRFIDGHFDNPGKARPIISIPARPEYDSDIRLIAYIKQSAAKIAALTERAEKLGKLYEAAKPLADMMSLAAFRSNPRMSDGYCSPMGGVKEYELRHQAAAIRDAVEKYDTARREAGRGDTDSAVAAVEGRKE